MSKKNNKNGKAKAGKWILLILAVLLAAFVLLMVIMPEDTEETTETAAAIVEADVSQWDSDGMYINDELKITDVGKYTGIYMEDGSDEVVTGVLMIIVENIGKNTIQYGEITIPTQNGDAWFKVTTLPAGESVVLLEQNRMPWSEQETYTKATADNVAFFLEEPTMCEDQLRVMALDGAINVTNISGAPIEEDIVIYYKNAASDLYYGGITYRIRIEGGMKADEIKQIMANHFSMSGSKIMFVTIG